MDGAMSPYMEWGGESSSIVLELRVFPYLISSWAYSQLSFGHVALQAAAAGGQVW